MKNVIYFLNTSLKNCLYFIPSLYFSSKSYFFYFISSFSFLYFIFGDGYIEILIRSIPKLFLMASSVPNTQQGRKKKDEGCKREHTIHEKRRTYNNNISSTTRNIYDKLEETGKYIGIFFFFFGKTVWGRKYQYEKRWRNLY